ncbi:MAG: sugar phosphate isomerase/epimerase [Armatimonadota bacterium]|nr:sugar phosphate isomerase/epimerase [Armatimonadota bacterium]
MSSELASKLAVQMFTIRDFTKTAKDLAESLAKISAMGYPAVQMSAVGAMSGATPEVSAEQARRMLDDNGLKCIATHRGWDDLANKTQQEIDFHQALGCDFTAIGSLPGSYRENGAAGYEQFVRDAEPVIARLKEAGLRFGYHNHAFEFERIGPGQRTLYDIFIEQGGPDFLLEIDVFWVAHAGANPERIIERCRGRVPVLHLKDKEMAGNDAVMAPIGEGNLDWPHLLPVCEAAGTEWYAVEQDVCRRDPFDCLKSSIEFLRSRK